MEKSKCKGDNYMEKTKALIKMAKEIHEENNDFEAVARTFETLKELCDEFLQTPYEGAMLVMRGNIKPEKKCFSYTSKNPFRYLGFELNS